MGEWKDYYDILWLDPNASEAEIKEAYRKRVKSVHPDHAQKTPAAKRHAEEEFKLVTEAYKVLIDPEKRRAYDSERLWRDKRGTRTQSPKPTPLVTPAVIRFQNVAPGKLQTSSFILENTGGPYQNIAYTDPASWVRVAACQSMNPPNELPLQFVIEAVGEDWGTSYIEYIPVALDNELIQVKVELQTKTKPRKRTSPSDHKTTSTAQPVAGSRSRYRKTKAIKPCREIVAGTFFFLMVLAGIIGSIASFAEGKVGDGLACLLLYTPIDSFALGGIGWLIGYVIDKMRGL